MAELTKSAGLPRPDIEAQGGCVTVRFRPSRYVPPEKVQRALSERQKQLLEALAASKNASLRELRETLRGKVPGWAVQEELGSLKNLGLVATAGHGRGAYWYLLK
jgi:ATP-dependent DNA helicase RecG